MIFILFGGNWTKIKNTRIKFIAVIFNWVRKLNKLNISWKTNTSLILIKITSRVRAKWWQTKVFEEIAVIFNCAIKKIQKNHMGYKIRNKMNAWNKINIIVKTNYWRCKITAAFIYIPEKYLQITSQYLGLTVFFLFWMYNRTSQLYHCYQISM